MNNISKNKGFIGEVILLIVAIIALKYFLNFDIIDWLKSSKAQEIIQPAINFFKTFYAWLDGLVKSIVAR